MSTEKSTPPVCAAAKTDWANLTHYDILKMNTYDFMAFLGKRVINPGGIRGRNQILDLLRPKPGSHVLEIGGGSGHAACYIAEACQCRVTTVDISLRSVQEARKIVSERGLSHVVKCETGDVNDLHFQEGTFDYVICQAVIMFVDQFRALSEVHRVLKQGGMFAGLEFSWKKSPPADVREKTHRVCGCTTLDFHSLDGWLDKLHAASFARVKGAEHPFGLLSLRGFLRDEGLANSFQIAMKVLGRRAIMIRMSEIWGHFSRHSEYFSYAVFAGEKSGRKRGGMTQ
jgi:SAM-dependent methyltransferase